MNGFTKLLKGLLTIAALEQNMLAEGRIFESLISYRQGSNSINLDSARFPYEEEQPQVPASVEEVFAYTAPSKTDDSKIDVVHAYSMQNGLFGSPEEARVFWTSIDFSTPNELTRGIAKDIRAVSISIQTKVEQFAVYESDLSVFLMGQTKRFEVVLHIVPGPDVSARPLRTFTFWPNQPFSTFLIDQLIILPQDEKAIFYSANHLGEIYLQGYPFLDDKIPEIKVHQIYESQSDDSSGDKSSETTLVQIQLWEDQLFLLMAEIVDGQKTLRIDST